MLALRPTFFLISTLPRAVCAGVPTLRPSVLWTLCASAAMSTPLLRSLTSRRLLTPVGSKPLWFVSLTSVSRDVCGTYSLISSVAPCPWSVLVALSLHAGSILALRKAELFLPFFAICSSTVSLPLSVLPFPVSPSLPLTSSVTSACPPAIQPRIPWLESPHFRMAQRFPAVHWELGIGDALHHALGRPFSLFGRLCAVDRASPRPPVTARRGNLHKLLDETCTSRRE